MFAPSTLGIEFRDSHVEYLGGALIVTVSDIVIGEPEEPSSDHLLTMVLSYTHAVDVLARGHIDRVGVRGWSDSIVARPK